MKLKLNLVLCPYCDKKAELVAGNVIYPSRKDLYGLKFYRCKPCNAYVGCHKEDGRPLGGLANEELRTHRQMAHGYFDPIWVRRHKSRKGAYRWLARKLKIEVDECHIGEFDIERCEQVVRLAKEYQDKRRMAQNEILE